MLFNKPVTAMLLLGSRRIRDLAFPVLPIVALLFVATLAMLGGFVLGRQHVPRARTARLDVFVMNAGQGEAAWIRTPGGHVIVIGAGPPGQGTRLVADLQHAGVKKIDLLALPYPYAEAVGGAAEIINALPVGEVIEPGGPIVNQWQARFRSICANHNIPDRAVYAGAQLVVDRVKIIVLGPGLPMIKADPAAANNSLVLQIRWRESGFVWAGGIERAGEDALLSRVPELSADWLRVAHFGTGNASSPEFLSAVSASTAVISAGANSQGYPNPQTISRLQATGAHIYRTASAQDHLHFYSDGSHINFEIDP